MTVKSKIKKHVIYFIIPAGVALLWIIFSVYTLLTYNASFTILPYSHMSKNVITPRRVVMNAGTTINGQFVAKDDNLGAVAVRLHNFHGGGVAEDTIVFKIKEKGAHKWYYQNNYTGGQFHELDLFPFGFPVISHSKGKTYVFQVHSDYGYDLTSLDLTDLDPIVISWYQYPKNILLHNRTLLQQFVIKKITFQLQNLDIKILLFIYSLPFILYLIGLSPMGRVIYSPILSLFKSIKNNFPKSLQLFFKNVSFFDLCIFSVLFIDVIFINGPDETVIFILFVFIFIKVILFKKWDYNEFSAAIIFLLMSPILLQLYDKPAALRAGIWVYVLLMIGTIKMVYSLFNETK